MNQPYLTTTIPIPAPPPAALGAAFRFAPGSDLRGGALAGTVLRPRPNVLQFRWPKGTPVPNRLVVEFLAERPRLLATEWILRGQQGTPKLVAGSAAAGQRFVIRKQRILAALEPGDPRRALALAWSDLDRRTDPEELRWTKQGAVAAAVIGLVQRLQERTSARCADAERGHEFEPVREHDLAAQPQAMIAENLFRSALLAVFPGAPTQAGQPRLDLRRFEATFAAFTVGELALSRLEGKNDPTDELAIDGIPDGPNYFAFAEAALLFLRLGLQPRFWRPLLPVFVAGTEFFAAHYWRPPLRRRGAYRPAHLTIAVPSTSLLAVLDQRHRAMTLGQLTAAFSSTVGFALRQEPGLPRPDHLPKEMLT